MIQSRGLGAAALLLPLLLVGCAGATPGPVTSESVGAQASGHSATSQQVMVTFPPAPPSLWTRYTAALARTYRMSIVVAWTLASIDEYCVVFEVPRGRSPAEVIRRLSSDPRVGLAQPVGTFETQTAGDPLANLQHGSQALHVQQAHRMATGKGVKVAVIDTGVDFQHPDLLGRIAKASDFVQHRNAPFTADVHGTAVAGVIAAGANNDVGIVGVAPGAEIYALKACWPRSPGSREAECNSYTLALAVEAAVDEKVQVMNLSLAGPNDGVLAKLLTAAVSRGIVVVAADGGAPGHSFPANVKGVLGVVGSDDLKGGLARPTERFSSSLAAPAIDIISTAPPNSYDFFSGSSLAAAEVTGIVALLLEKNPKLSPAQIREILQKTSHPLAPPPGLPDPPVAQADACAAVAALSGGEGCS
ncbi:MAG TPA: S8 family serine peptidase [Thermoanaerobaculia bacterium]|nr:S8 family serine peptidase [Thermoanaerobaculia bacterium]